MVSHGKQERKPGDKVPAMQPDDGRPVNEDTMCSLIGICKRQAARYREEGLHNLLPPCLPRKNRGRYRYELQEVLRFKKRSGGNPA